MMVMMVREFGVVFPASTDYATQYYMWDYLRNEGVSLQQNLFDPPSVSGWPAYYQMPMFYEMWINHDTMPKRVKFIDALMTTGYTRNNFKLIIDPVTFTDNNFPSATILNLDTFIDAVLDVLYRVPVTATTKARIKTDILLAGQYDDNYWTNAWYTYIGDRTNMAGYTTVYNRLQPFYQYLLGLAEYQLA